MKCPSCGANLKKNLCEYCGYEHYVKDVADDPMKDAMDTFNEFMHEFDNGNVHVTKSVTKNGKVVETSYSNSVDNEDNYMDKINDMINKQLDYVDDMMSKVNKKITQNVDINFKSTEYSTENFTVTVDGKEIDID